MDARRDQQPTSGTSRIGLQESSLRRYNQIVYRLAALTWIITQVFDWSLLTMNLEELISSAASRAGIVFLLWSLQRWLVPHVSWKTSGSLFILINFGALWGVGSYLWMPSVGTLPNLALLIALSTLANILILGVVRAPRPVFLIGAVVVALWYTLVGAEREFPAQVAWILLGFVLGFATLLYFSIETIATQIFTLESRYRNRLEAERNNLAAVIQSMADGVVLTDGAGAVRQANSAFLELVGRSEEEVLSRPLADWVAEGPDGGEASANGDGAGPPGQRNPGISNDETIFDQEVYVSPSRGGPVKAFLSGSLVRGPDGGTDGHVYVLRDARSSPLAARLNLAELKALKAQINPHFLFNTLNTLSSLIMTDPERAERATQLLSMHFRKVLSISEREWVSLGEELEFLRAYLEIQQFRHEGQLEVTYDVDPHCLELRLPTMLLQPLAENAIQHGFRDKFEKWRIELSARPDEDGRCRIKLTDNGEGIPASKLGHLLEGEGHGLKNVNQRLLLYYGETAEIVVESEPHQGTSFTLRVPSEPLHQQTTSSA